MSHRIKKKKESTWKVDREEVLKPEDMKATFISRVDHALEVFKCPVCGCSDHDIIIEGPDDLGMDGNIACKICDYEAPLYSITADKQGRVLGALIFLNDENGIHLEYIGYEPPGGIQPIIEKCFGRVSV